MGVVYYRSLARSRAARPKRNGTETERKCNGGVQVIERQMAELAFRFDGTERNGNITVFMPPTVHENSVGLSSTTNPKPKGQPSISLSAQANLTQQKAHVDL